MAGVSCIMAGLDDFRKFIGDVPPDLSERGCIARIKAYIGVELTRVLIRQGAGMNTTSCYAIAHFRSRAYADTFQRTGMQWTGGTTSDVRLVA